ncbi:vWA domain-containing protein [Devosia faecipullorum]|uniref:vWA domain-containing protein n=1 Tax=Devosia faecipullorum TaxID=2755039 RepID=UPI002ED9BD28
MDMRLPIGSAVIALLVLPLGVQLYYSTAMRPDDLALRAPMAQPEEKDNNILTAPDGMSAMAEQEVAHEAPPVLAEPAPPMVSMDPAPVPISAPAPAMANRAGAPMAEYSQNMAAPFGGAMPKSMGIVPPLSNAEPSGDSFSSFDEQRLKAVAEEPVSTFSLDVDTASYAYVRRMLEDGVLPARDAVRIEELINYFPYAYPLPASADIPFQPQVQVYPTPWNDATQILQIGIKGFEPVLADTKSNLVFLIDTSGSMDAPDKLPLLKRAFGLLLDQLSDNDSVAIVTYAGSAGIALPPTNAGRKADIMAALDQLYAGGSTAGAEGIELAYRLADEARIADGTNRVILATDGDFNVGIDDPEQLKHFIADKRASGIGLSVLGFGRGNLDDATMQALAQNGDGNASYIASFAEAKKVLVEEIGGTLHTIARDVKVQVEFNPAMIAEYRLIGYETRALNREDFNNDAVDAGDVGAGTSVTALYEITPVGSGRIDPLRYGESVRPESGSDEIAFLKMRYKLPDSDVSQLIEMPVTPDLVYGDIEDAGLDAQFAAAIAAFGQKLKSSVYGSSISWDEIKTLARAGRGPDEGGYRAEFIRLVDMAAMLKPDAPTKR